MENNFNFKSQICTTRQSSERLLALGLKKETADMTIHIKDDDGWYVTAEPFCEWEDDRNTFPCLEEPEPIVPAWSLHRLLCLIPREVTIDGYTFPLRKDMLCMLDTEDDDMYQAIVDVVTRGIELGYFPKEYLVDQAAIEEHCKGVLEYLDYIKGKEE